MLGANFHLSFLFIKLLEEVFPFGLQSKCDRTSDYVIFSVGYVI
jgi:hypothetical protein